MLAMGMMLGGLPVFDITLSSNRAQWQRSVDAPQVPSTVPVCLILRIASAIEVQSNSTALAAIVIDQLAPGSQFFLFNSGYAIGKGGAGRAGASSVGLAPGLDGGDALRLDFTGYAEITNSAGRIWGGGGGGAGGGGCQAWNAIDFTYEPHNGGGGGGGGAGGGAAGAAGTNANPGGAGSSGSAGVNGSGGAGDGSSSGAGGAGGAYGTAGSASSSGARHGGPGDGTLSNSSAGGAAGNAIRHNAGTTVNIVSGSGSPNVRGSVGT